MNLREYRQRAFSRHIWRDPDGRFSSRIPLPGRGTAIVIALLILIALLWEFTT